VNRFLLRFLLKAFLLTLIITLLPMVIPSVSADSCYILEGTQCSSWTQTIPPTNYIYQVSATTFCEQLSPQLCYIPGCCCFSQSGNTIGLSISGSAYCDYRVGIFTDNPLYVGQAQCELYCANNPATFYSISGTVTNTAGLTQTNAQIRIQGLGVDSTTFSSSGFYLFDSLPAGQSYVINANYSDCSSPTITTGNLNSDRTIDLVLSDCCQYSNCDWTNLACVNSVKTCTLEPLPSSPLSCQDKVYTSVCTIPTCDWTCSEWVCQGGVETRSCDKTISGQLFNWNSPPLPQSPECEGQPPRPPETRACTPPPGGDRCGDGIIFPNSVHKCDLFVGPPEVYSTILNGGCPKSRCNFETCMCNPEPPNIICEINPGKISSFTATDVPRLRAFDTTWIVDLPGCYDYIDHFTISRCTDTSSDNSGCTDSFFPLSNNINKLERIYRDVSSVPPNPITIYEETNYCYNLTLYYDNNVALENRVKSERACQISGEDECLAPTPPAPKGWCIDDIPVTCDGQNMRDYGECDGTCQINPLTNNPECIPENLCENCNSILWMFGQQGYTIFDEDNAAHTCPKLSPLTSRYVEGCYIDYSFTIADMTYACSEVNTCYDYNSKTACEFNTGNKNDICGKFTGTEKCVWENYSNDIKKGVCHPADIASQDCSYCQDGKDYNRIYPDCTREVCELYGNCYFNNTNNECLNGDSLVCSSYSTQQECTGSRALNVNTSYNVGVRVGGTNELISTSADLMTIGRCRWIGGSCIKDADFSSTNDCTITDPDLRKKCEKDIAPPISYYNPKDTYGMMMDLSGLGVIDNRPEWRLLDDTAPGESVASTRKGLWLYYCINAYGNGYGNCYPNTILNTQHPDNKYRVAMNTYSEGQYLFRYFAEDPAKNLEIVKEFDFYLDKSPPVIDPDLTITTYRSNEKIPDTNPVEYYWITNLGVRLTLTDEHSPPVNCSFTLSIAPGLPAPLPLITPSEIEPFDIPSEINIDDKITSVNGYLQTSYPDLSSGRYLYTLRCTDSVGNAAPEVTQVVVLDGDLTISDPKPVNITPPLRSIDLPPIMSVNTTANGTCRYSAYTTNYLSMLQNNGYGFGAGQFTRNDLGGGKYIHTAPIDALIDINGNPPIYETGVYRYNVACNFTINGQSKIITGSNADSIDFAIDEDPPETLLTNIYLPGIPYVYNASDTRNYFHFELKCNDTNSALLDENINGEELQRWFGCYDKSEYDINPSSYWCLKRTVNNNAYGTCVPQPYSPYDYIKLDYINNISLYNTYGNKPHLCYYSVDKGGNIAGERCTRINIQDTTFGEPDIFIHPS
jgi:hypothetical protein